MNYNLIPSLEHMTLVRIVVRLWCQDDVVKTLVAKFVQSLINSERRRDWQKIEDKVIEKVSELSLPQSMKYRILCFIKPIGFELLKWKIFHSDYLSEWEIITNLSRLHWTPRGTIDRRKTAEMLIQDENLDIGKRYELTYVYCFEFDLPVLWNKIPKIYRKSYKNPMKMHEEPLVVFWSSDIEEKSTWLNSMIERRRRNQHCTPYQRAFEKAAFAGSKTATEYFFHKLTSRERRESLVRSARYAAKMHSSSVINYSFGGSFIKEHYTDVLCFLLLQMNENQQMEVFNSYPYHVLNCFLNWPWQSLFIETAQYTWPFLSEKQYDCLLNGIVNYVIDGYKDYNYQKLFTELWEQGPNSHKKFVIDMCSCTFLLSKLLRVKDEENTKLILKDATSIEKKKLIFSNKGKKICEDLINNDKWSFLEFFIQECIPSKNEIIQFGEEFQEHCYCAEEEKIERKIKRNKFFQLLNDLIQRNDAKREIEEESGNLAKKFCSIELEKESLSMTK